MHSSIQLHILQTLLKTAQILYADLNNGLHNREREKELHLQLAGPYTEETELFISFTTFLSTPLPVPPKLLSSLQIINLELLSLF